MHFLKTLRLLFIAVLLAHAGQVFAVIQVAAAASASTGGTAATSLSINAISTAARADVLLAQLTLDSASATVTGIPSGWTELTAVAQTTTGLAQHVYYKVRSNTDTASFAWTFSSAVHATLILLDTNGVDTSVPINAYSSGIGSGTSIVAPEVAAQTANSLLVAFFGSASSTSGISSITSSSSSSGSISIPTNGTASAGTGLAAAIATTTVASAGLTGTLTATAANAANIGQMVALTAANTTTPCFTDSFGRSALGSNWVSSAASGSFVPAINTAVSRLQLTQNTGSQATLAILQRLFPAAGNLVQVTFQHYAYPNSSGADGMVTIFSDAKVNPVAGGSGGSLGYAQYTGNIAGFAGGWLGVGLDEFGNFSNPTENRYQGPTQEPNAVAIRGPSNSFYSSGSASTYADGYPYLTGANNLSPALRSGTSVAAGGGPGDWFRISIDSRVPGEQWVQVERSIDGVTYTTPVGYFNLMAALKTVFGASTQLPTIPTNFWLSFSGGTGGSTNIHEIGNLSVCATRMVSSSPVIDHFRFENPVTMNTCQPATVKVTACTAASPACSPLTGTDVYVSLKPTGWVGGDSVTLLNGQGTLQLAQTSSGTVTLDIDRTKAIFPSMISSSTASDCVGPGNTNTTSTTSCSFTVSTSAAGFGVTFPTASITSCADSGSITIKACSSSYASTTKNLQYWFSYTDPASGTLPVTLSTDSWATTKTLATAVPTSSTAPATISATFNSSSQTTVRIKYADVGKVTLNVRDSAATTVTGSGYVVVTPASYSITTVKDMAGNSSPIPMVDANSSMFVSAGSSFKVTAQAMNSCSPTPGVTPNFGQESTKEGILLARALPTGLGLPHNPNLNVISDFQFANGVGTATVSWPEVGILQLTPNLKSGSYMGTGNVQPQDSSVTVGRFYADHFDVSATNACTSFTYDRQPFSSYSVTAMSSSGTQLQNYSGVSSNSALRFSRTVTLTDSTGSGTMPQLLATNFIGGQASLTGSTPTLTATAATYTLNTPPSVPFNASIGAADSDNTNSTGAVVSMPIRSGRLHMFSAYGSNLLPMHVPLRAEYYAASGSWVTNTSDTCTSPVSGNFALGNRTPSTMGSSISSIAVRSAGVWDVVLAKPSSPGVLDLVANLNPSGSTAPATACLPSWTNGPDSSSSANLPHLLGSWCGTTPIYDPLVRVRFGTPNAPYIFMREMH